MEKEKKVAGKGLFSSGDPGLDTPMVRQRQSSLCRTLRHFAVETALILMFTERCKAPQVPLDAFSCPGEEKE